MFADKFVDLQACNTVDSTKALDLEDSLSKSSPKHQPLDWQLTAEFRNCIEQAELQLTRLTDLLHSVHA